MLSFVQEFWSIFKFKISTNLSRSQHGFTNFLSQIKVLTIIGLQIMKTLIWY